MRNEGTRKVRLSDIADACGVRASTVSRVLSGFSDGFSVKEDVRKLIEETASKMNYVPNAAAKQLRSNRSMNIQVFGFHFGWFGSYSLILEHCTAILNEKGYMVNAVFGDYRKMQFAPMQTDGIIMLTAENKELLCRIRESGVPFIVINDCLREDECWVAYNDRCSVRKNMEYLIRKGYRNIVYSGHFGFFDHTTHSSIRVRREEYLKICSEYGIEPRELPVGVQPETAARFVRDCNADGVICYSAANAAELVNLLAVLDIQVPQQIEVLCFGLPGKNAEKITYTEIDVKEVGITVAELLLNRIEHGLPGHRIFDPSFYGSYAFLNEKS